MSPGPRNRIPVFRVDARVQAATAFASGGAEMAELSMASPDSCGVRPGQRVYIDEQLVALERFRDEGD